MMTRTAARQLAVQLCFAASAGSDLSPEEFFSEEYFGTLPQDEPVCAGMPDEAQKRYIITLVNGVAEHREELDALISRYSHGWKIGRISKTALSVLRCAIYEILYMPDIPAAASINEAVELDKGYDEPETVSFVNGILGSIVRAGSDGEEK